MTPTHAKHFERSLRAIPWATQTNAKRHAGQETPSQPPFIKRAKGCRLWDLDGKEYIDYRAALGPIILGYRYPAIDDAVRRQMELGTLFSMASPIEAEAAEAILDTLGWADKIRFMKTGADACASCLRLARSKTGRDHFLTSGYHGYQDWFALAWPNHGIPAALEEFVHEIDYGDLEAVEYVFQQYGSRLAAVMVTPVEWHRPVSREYLRALRSRCNEHGTVLVFDEILTGFRLTNAGARGYFDIEPDMAAYAKGMANGYPLSAYAGKAEFMDTLDQTIITTTYAGETLSLAAAQAAMQVFQDEPVIEHLAAMGERLRAGLNQIFADRGYPAQAHGLPQALSIDFQAHDDAKRDLQRNALFERLYQNGVFANKEWFVTYSHQPSDIDETLEKFDASIRSL